MNNITDRDTVRQYLLGKLNGQTELEANLSDGILFNDEMGEIADSVEDEIIEDYLDGSLDSADRRAVDQYFLQAPQRKEKLRFAKLLRHHLDTKPVHYADMNRGDLVRPPARQPNRFRAYALFAALVLISSASLIYVMGIRRSHTRLEAKLGQERERYANLQRETAPAQSSMVSLTLVADRSRGAAIQIPHVEIDSSTRRIIVDIALQAGASGPYDVRLESKGGGEPLWSARLLPLISPTGDARLVFDMPAQGIKSGVYSFVVSGTSPATGGLRHYDFEAMVG
jgi:hypothetical protein